MAQPKILVIGLDGACWNLIEEWIKNGELPSIKGLRAESSWGPLESCVPPVTFPAWKCYSTGKNPGKLGVFWWQHLDIKSRKVNIPNSKSFKSPEIWDYLNRQGVKTGVIGMPGTFPPRKVDGFMIAGGPDCGKKGYTYPKTLEYYLQKKRYQVHPLIPADFREDSPLIDEMLKVINFKFKMAELLKEKMPVDFLHITIFYLNYLQHYFYQGNPTKRAWKLIDNALGCIRNGFDYIVIMSDHGTAPMLKTFFINAWLEKEGYLHLRGKAPLANLLFKIGFNRNRILNILEVLHLANFMSRFQTLKTFAKRFTLDGEGSFSDRCGNSALKGIDWKKTKVIGSPQGPLYINREVVKSKSEYERLRTELIDKLEQYKDPETNKNPIERVCRREDIFSGEYVKDAPDLIALDSDEYHNRGGIGNSHIFVESKWKGNNAKYGLFMISGPGIKRDMYTKGFRIYDLAPTILHMMNCPIPEDMDGEVLREIFL